MITDNNSDYELWFIDFFVQRTKETLDGYEKDIETLKARATSLLSWVITLSVASITACAASILKHNIIFSISLGVISTLLILTAICCVVVLFSKKWRKLDYRKKYFDDFYQDSQIETLKVQLDAHFCTIEENIIYYQRTQRFMKLAWVLFCLTPLSLVIMVFNFSFCVVLCV